MAELWHYTSKGKPMQPVSIETLKQLVEDGILKPVDLVWRNGMPRWQPASSFSEIYPKSESTNIPPSAPPEIPTVVVRPIEVSPAVEKLEPTPTYPVGEPVKLKRMKSAANSDRARKRQEPAPRVRSNGFVVALSVGGGILILAMIVSVTVFLFIRAHQPPNQFRAWGKGPPPIFFGSNKPDMDIYLYDKKDKLIVKDSEPTPNAVVQFTPELSDEYSIVIQNCNQPPFLNGRASVTVRENDKVIHEFKAELKPGSEHLKYFTLKQGSVYTFTVISDVVNGEIKEDLGDDRKEDFDGGTELFRQIGPGQERLFRFLVPAKKEVIVRVLPFVNEGKFPDLRLEVFSDQNDKLIGADQKIGGACEVRFRATLKQMYNVRLKNVGELSADCQVSYVAAGP